MGLESRDYYRDGCYTARLTDRSGEVTPVIEYLIIAHAVLFLLQIFIPPPVRPAPPESLLQEIERQQEYLKMLEREDAKPEAEAPAPGKDGALARLERKRTEESIRQSLK